MAKEITKDEYTVCDQCRVRKIRCSREKPSCRNCGRLGLQCEWSGQGKKCNQTTLLSHTILGMGSRLQQLETSLADTQRSLKRLFEGSAVVSPPSSRYPSSPSRPTPQLTPPRFPDGSKAPVFTRPLGRFLLDHGNDQRYFGPTSLEALMLTIKDELSDSTETERESTRECVLQAQHKINILVSQADESKTCLADRSLPTTPPFAILDAMIEPYFTTTNHHFPIWTKEKVQADGH
ncbi:Zn(II)2Cys6 transcription factor domain-containing protein [Aspergillus clavatus NRRL 1]|uniref:C6 zinc finger domain protein n=1 Tax=Aspergillus clavatus (strain ATCC 1007 / CBS 513.65 / DSM 816 / NCTC 3887 / NRRL 1 / QM 1276 / 107) TaxID=344612 RepID=A1C8J3_ASPCL|nr:C6 zinc finger domain protein [Aspergillus clavatus NRRL 1]EAW13630.1 C6 zinc finger domain protein [Aspergillus clavatus NRRL 1]